MSSCWKWLVLSIGRARARRSWGCCASACNLWNSHPLPMRGLVERMAQLTIVTLLLEQAQAELLRGPAGTGKRKWLIALLFLHRHILVHPDGWAADNDPTAFNHFDALVDWQPVPVEQSSELSSNSVRT